MSTETKVIGTPIMSGFCAHPSTPAYDSHTRCRGGSTANPRGEFHPCPCACHLDPEEYECECGRIIRLAPLLGLDEDGDEIYVHIDPKDGRAVLTGCA